MFDAAQKIADLGRRFAEAGRRARADVLAAAGPVCGEVAAATAAAAGELVRCAVAGAITAVMQGPRRTSRQTGDTNDPWDVLEDQDHDGEDLQEREPMVGVSVSQQTETTKKNESGSCWMTATRMAGSALTVAAGAAASVPGGRLVAAGLGAVAAMATLAARAGEDTSS